jgi:hypothetical protein
MVIKAIIIKKFRPKGSQPLAADRSTKARKLKGGPGTPGTTHPIRPTIMKIEPMMINTITAEFSEKNRVLNYYILPTAFQSLDCHCKHHKFRDNQKFLDKFLRME